LYDKDVITSALYQVGMLKTNNLLSGYPFIKQ